MSGGFAPDTPMPPRRNRPLTREQAQAIADIIGPHADEYYDLVERAQERFPEHDWIALCLPDWADPRPRIPPVPFIGPKLPNEQARRVDRALTEYVEGIREALRAPNRF